MSVYVVRPDDSVYSVNRQVALVGFAMRGEDVRLFDAGDIDDIAISDGDIVFGGVKIVHRAFERLGLSVPAIDSIPECLSQFARRETWQSPIGEIRRKVQNGEAIFIKPVASQLKLFAGQALRSFSDLLATAHLSDDTLVECAAVTKFVSEFRTFVLHGEVIGVRHYGGDPLGFPDPEVIREMITRYTDAPVSYALDVGVVGDGHTQLVEINDSYATGAYGLAPALYASMIDARWQEIRQHQTGTTS